jgi:hypothetical protein
MAKQRSRLTEARVVVNSVASCVVQHAWVSTGTVLSNITMDAFPINEGAPFARVVGKPEIRL